MLFLVKAFRHVGQVRSLIMVSDARQDTCMGSFFDRRLATSRYGHSRVEQGQRTSEHNAITISAAQPARQVAHKRYDLPLFRDFNIA